MGLDGGTLMSRSDILRRSSQRVADKDTSRSTRGGTVGRVADDSVEKSVASATAWSTCALSSQPLRDPIVACGLGRLYNKEAALQFLLAKKGVASKPEELLQYANQLRAANGALDHVSGMKDLLELHLTPAAPEHEGSGRISAAAAGGAAGAGPSGAAGAGPSGGGNAPAWVCPVTLLPCERHPCSALRPCGHVLSDRAIRNLNPGGAGTSSAAAGGGGAGGGGSGGGDATCPVCGVPYTSTLPIHGTQEQVAALRERLRAEAERAAAAKAAKAAAGKGGKKRKAAGPAEAEAGAEADERVETEGGKAARSGSKDAEQRAG